MQAPNLEKIFAKPVSGKGLDPKYTKDTFKA